MTEIHCVNCGVELDPEDEHEAGACEECLSNYWDILNSEEAKYYKQPYKLQIWSDKVTVGEEGFGEVEVVLANYTTVGFKDPRREMKHTYIRKEDFLRWFAFVKTTY